nr:hypothetical protein [uncultured Desulfobacter sp.]
MKAQIGKVFWYCSTSNGDPSDCVKWAEAALYENFDSPSLRILAGLSAPLNFFEVKYYTEAALSELGIEIPCGSRAVSAYAKDIACDIINKPETIRLNLKELFELCIAHNYQDDIFDFYLLHCAWEDFDHGEFQYYWDGATKENIKIVVIEKCKEYIK